MSEEKEMRLVTWLKTSTTNPVVETHEFVESLK